MIVPRKFVHDLENLYNASLLFIMTPWWWICSAHCGVFIFCVDDSREQKFPRIKYIGEFFISSNISMNIRWGLFDENQELKVSWHWPFKPGGKIYFLWRKQLLVVDTVSACMHTSWKWSINTTSASLSCKWVQGYNIHSTGLFIVQGYNICCTVMDMISGYSLFLDVPLDIVFGHSICCAVQNMVPGHWICCTGRCIVSG
jgi:hypothetical protein